MRKSTRIVKRVFALLLVVLMSIESLGAVVSDNDGSAFITKAEFDSLKNDFQAQIDQYYSSIDSKIDGAIAGYLAGVLLAKKTEMILPYSNNNFWIYRNNGVAMPEITARFLLHNFNNGSASQRFKLWFSTDETFKILPAGAPALWINEDTDDTYSLLYDGALDDKVMLAITETYESGNYWGVWRTPNRVGVYLDDSGTALNLETYNYQKSPSNYGQLRFNLAMYHTSGVVSDSGGKIYVNTEVSGVDTVDWGNNMHITKENIKSYVANVTLGNSDKWVPLTIKDTDMLWCIQYNSTFPTLYRWNKSGIWQTGLQDIEASGTHKFYSTYGNTSAVDGRTVGQVSIGSGTKWFYGKNNMYTLAQKRTNSSSAYTTWFTPTTKQVVIAPHSGLITASNIFQRIKDKNNNKIKSHAGILLTAKSEGQEIEFKLNLQAKQISSTGLVNIDQTYKVAASKMPFGSQLNNTEYLKINGATTDTFDLPSNGTHSIKIKDIEKGDSVYFKILPIENVDVEVKISDCYITIE
ncbi:MAG: hypothetical protein J6M39_02145 [Lachnospiraceae bacterium]|nr:hypothetical protein [Lachnospiraceae bacterium]